MAFDGVPWMIGGGEAVHSADVARQLAFMASSGATGVTLPGDLRVSALPTPGAAVRIGPGGGPIANTYSGGSGQSYVVRNPSATNLSVPATGSGGGATRYVIVRIDDPQYGGATPTNPASGPYVKPALVSSISGITYPHMVLAKIVQPANTATITNAMITDLREVAVPRTLDVWRPRALVTADTETLTAAPSGVGEWFPNNGGPQTIDIPSWATRAQIRCSWLGVRYGAGNAWGEMWVEYGPYKAASERERSTQRFQFDTPAANNVSRANWIVVDDVYIPAAYRGTSQMFVPKAKRLGGVTGSVQVDAKSGMSLEVRFLEVADPSTT